MTYRFYLLCVRDTVGTNASFHCKNGAGYSTNIDKAHVYTLSEAQHAWDNGRSIELPLSADAVDALSVLHVDHQVIPCKTTQEEGCTEYVAFVKGRWDGNDLYWLSDGSLPTTDFSKATIYPAVRPADMDIVWLPYHLAGAVKRRTFNINLLDSRKMIQGAGLRMPEHVKRQRRRERRPATGKVRWNCPVCGKISWQFSPYDFDGCLNWSCEGHKS